MKKAIRILIPIFLAVAIIACTAWYLFVYDRPFTRDVLLSCARYSDNNGNHNVATWFYNLAYSQSGDNDAVAIELAEQYKSSGNYTKAEFTLSNAIADGGGIELYIALCKTYLQQDKLLDAVNMLDNISNEEIKAQLNQLRPAAPQVAPKPGFYNQYISATLTAESGTIYASAKGVYPSVKQEPYSKPIPLVDGENTIYALSVSENGLVSPLSIFGYTIGGVIQEIKFSDSVIETEIRTLLNVGEDVTLFTNDLWTIKEFTVPAGAKSYADIKNMVFLESLTVENGVAAELSNIAPLSNLLTLNITGTAIDQEVLKSIGSLPKLQNLKLQNCSLTSIAPLQTAVELIKLDLNNNTIRNIDAISNMKNLQELNLQHNAVTDLTALASVSTLKTLDVSFNSLTSLAPISTLTGITWLDAGTNTINSLGDINKLTALTYLNLKSNKLTSVSVLKGCTAITELDISSNALTSIDELSALTNMMYFYFSYNQVKNIPKFSKNCALVTIDGSNNKISSVENLSGLKNLNKVNMDYNASISSVKSLAKCPNLIEVNVYATKVKDVRALTDQSIIVNYKPV